MGTVHLVPCHRGPGAEEQALFSFDKIHVCLRCYQASWRARTRGGGSQCSRESSCLQHTWGYQVSKAAQVLHPGAMIPSGHQPRRCSLPALPRDKSRLPHLYPDPKG